MAQNLRRRQKAWNDATQARISMTSSILGSMKSVKMLGISEGIASQIQDLRQEELDMAKKVRWMMFAYNASGMFLHLLFDQELTISSQCAGNILSSDHFSLICCPCTLFRQGSNAGYCVHYKCDCSDGNPSC